MCGIAGFVTPQPISPHWLHAMCDVIAHRGPDDAGFEVWPDHCVGLGHRRLSIIDLSPAGHNPMCNEDGTVWIVFNGEIYNFQELRRELEQAGHSFRSQSDTEVIIHAYEEWGDEHVKRLRGMFAYALYDRRLQNATNSRAPYRLLLVRDRLGIKPLFYYLHDHLFLFASEIKAILAHPGARSTVDRSALFDYLTYAYIPAPKTAYMEIRKLRPGHYLAYEDGRCSEHIYWDVQLNAPSPVRTSAEAAELVRSTLTEAVQLHMISDVPLGVFLSGGLDSSTVTALMAGLSAEPVRTFAIGFDVTRHSETHYARMVADRYRTQHHEHIVGVDEAQVLLPLVVNLYDEPYADGSAVPTYRVSALARDQVKVVLSGDGGDEVFAGYLWYTKWLQRMALDRLPVAARRSLFAPVAERWPANWLGRSLIADLPLGPLERYARRLELFSPLEKRRMLTPTWNQEFADYDDYWYFRQYWLPELDPLTRMQYLDLKTYLPDDILTKVDRASMAVSLEVRPPLLDHVLVEQLFAIPAQIRAPQGEKKHLLKQSVNDLLPEPILNRPKKGFSAPWTTWMTKERQWAQQRLKAEDPMGMIHLDGAILGELFQSGNKVWSLLILSQWQNDRRF